MRFSSMALITLLVIAPTSITANDWPQWNGPERDGTTPEKGLMQKWPDAGPPLAWKTDAIGGGYSAPSIVNGKMYLLSNRNGDEVVLALSESDGSELWAAKLGPAVTGGARQGNEGPGSSPTVEGDRMYVLGAGGALACLQVADGKIVWQHNLIDDFGGVLPTWRYSESPLIDGDKLICTPGGPDATLVALNKSNGETIWKSKVAEPQSNSDNGGRRRRRRGPSSGAGYSSAIAINFEGQRQYVQLTATALVGVAADDGEVLWTYDRPANSNRINCSSPRYHNGMVFAASAYGNGGGAVKLTKAGDAIKAEEVYFTKNMKNHHGGMVIVDGFIYGANGGNSGGFLACIDFESGETMWQDRKAPKGSVAYADGRIYLRAEDGEVVLVEPNKEKFVEHGRFKQPDRTRSPAWTHPVIANGKLYIRDQDTLYCYNVASE